jgi:hypothetical protein
MPTRAPDAFQFRTTLTLREATGIRAVSIAQLVKYLRTAPDAVIYYHTHAYVLEHHYLAPELPNDFAYWVTEVLGDKDLGERLASVDTIQFASIPALRDRLVQVIDEYLEASPLVRLRTSSFIEAFHFIKAVSVVVATPHMARTLEEFAKALEAVSTASLYFHMFEARLRLRRGANDFSQWFRSLGEESLARAVSTLDPYTHTLDELRHTIIALVRERLAAATESLEHAREP